MAYSKAHFIGKVVVIKKGRIQINFIKCLSTKLSFFGKKKVEVTILLGFAKRRQHLLFMGSK